MAAALQTLFVIAVIWLIGFVFSLQTGYQNSVARKSPVSV